MGASTSPVIKGEEHEHPWGVTRHRSSKSPEKGIFKSESSRVYFHITGALILVALFSIGTYRVSKAAGCYSFYFSYDNGLIDQGCSPEEVITPTNFPGLHVARLDLSCADDFPGGGSNGLSDLSGLTVVSWWIIKLDGTTCGTITPTPTVTSSPTVSTTPTPTVTSSPTVSTTPTTTDTASPDITSTPTEIYEEWDFTCWDLGWDEWQQLAYPPYELYDLGFGHWLSIDFYGEYLDWEASLPIAHVIIHTDDFYTWWNYPPDTFFDSGLYSPSDSTFGPPQTINYVYFCFDYPLVEDATPTATATPTPTEQVEFDDVTCGDIGWIGNEFLVDPPQSGFYSLGNGHWLTVEYYGLQLDWESSVPVSFVIVGSQTHFVGWQYTPAAYYDIGVGGPVDELSGLPEEFTEIYFCFNYPAVETATPTPETITPTSMHLQTSTPTLTSTPEIITPTNVQLQTSTPAFTFTPTPTTTPAPQPSTASQPASNNSSIGSTSVLPKSTVIGNQSLPFIPVTGSPTLISLCVDTSNTLRWIFGNPNSFIIGFYWKTLGNNFIANPILAGPNGVVLIESPLENLPTELTVFWFDPHTSTFKSVSSFNDGSPCTMELQAESNPFPLPRKRFPGGRGVETRLLMPL